jgi:DNA topoisomerase-2
MYVGSIKLNNATEWLQNEDKKFEKTDVEYIPGFMKLFDEIVSNSVDESKRNPKLDSIVVKVNESTGSVSIYDNGGIPVVIHDVQNIWIPELIFGELLTSSNYNDDEVRVVGGVNGLGIKLTNIFSKSFTIETVDSTRKKIYKQVFTENLTNKEVPDIKSCQKKSYTKITFLPDYEKFGLTNMTDDIYNLFKRRVRSTLIIIIKKSNNVFSNRIL